MNELFTFDPTEFADPLSDYEPVQYRSELQRALAEDPVDSIQHQPFVQIRPTAPIRQAVQTLHGSRVSVLLVVENDRVVGIFTERDVLEKVAERYAKLANVPVREVMTSNPTVVYESDPAAAAIAAIAVAGHRHVPVLGVDNCLKGFVSPQRVFDFIEQHFDDDGLTAGG
jgi:CBS domain-containing protein